MFWIIPLLLLNTLVNIKLTLGDDNPYKPCLEHKRYDMGETCELPNDSGFMHEVESQLRSQKTLIDISTCPEALEEQWLQSHDFVVVGAGAAGSIVARRLSDAGHSVLLLEAGGPAPPGTQIPGMYFQYDGNPDIDWDFKLERESYACLSQGGVCSWPRGKVIGGTTQLHGMMYMRGYPEDFDRLNLTGWTWDDMMKQYLKSEDNTDIGTYADKGYHSTGGLLTVSRFPDAPPIANKILEGAKELGFRTNIDLNGKHRIGFTLAQATVRNGERLSTSRAYLYDPIKPENVTVLDYAYVRRVLFDQEKKAIGVEFDRFGKTYVAKVNKEVVLSAGTVQSPQILMLSGVGPQAHLEELGIPVVENLPGVGKNLRNHASFSVNFKVLDDNGVNPMNTDTLKTYIETRKGPLSSTGLSQLTGFLHTKYNDPSVEGPDFQMFFAGYLAGCSKDGSPNKTIPTRYISITPTLLHPKSVGYLLLRDQFAQSPPKIYANLLGNKHDIKILIEGIKIAKDLANTTALRNVLELDTEKAPGCIQYEFDTDEYWECAIRYYTNPENHQVGTCKMGVETDKMAVTNEKLQVYGVQNLRVVDASILPWEPSGNLLAPTTAVGEKGAELIIDHWKQ